MRENRMISKILRSDAFPCNQAVFPVFLYFLFSSKFQIEILQICNTDQRWKQNDSTHWSGKLQNFICFLVAARKRLNAWHFWVQEELPRRTWGSFGRLRPQTTANAIANAMCTRARMGLNLSHQTWRRRTKRTGPQMTVESCPGNWKKRTPHRCEVIIIQILITIDYF